MKILHLLDEPWDSGISAYALQVAELLQNDQHEIVVGVRSGKKPEALAKAKGLKTHSIDSVSQLWTLVRSKPWDLINVHTGRSHSWAVLINTFSKRKIPIVRTRGDARIVSVNALSHFNYKRTSAVIAASEHIGQQYNDGFPYLRSRIHIIYPSVNIAQSHQAPFPNRVGILGRLDPVKGHSVLLEAVALVLKEFPVARFAVAGKEANLSISLLKNQADILGVSHAVNFLGFQNSAENFMQGCSLGVISSIGSEEISRACLEWFAVGRPVVGTLVGSLPELIEPGENGFLVPPNDSVSLAQAILNLLKNNALRESMSRKAQQQALLKFGPDRLKQQLLGVYASLVIQ